MNNLVDEVEISQPMQNHSQDSFKIDVAAVVQDMVDLKELLTKETIWLKKMDMENVANIHDKKLRLIRRLEIQQELIAKNPNLLGSGSNEEREYLKQLRTEMDEVIKSNFKQVLNAREINKRVVDAISKAVGQNKTKATGYDGGGVSYNNGAKPPSVDSSYAVTINETI